MISNNPVTLSPNRPKGALREDAHWIFSIGAEAEKVTDFLPDLPF